ncbi:hypothetical protein BGZ57DRAFT_822965 [Hyaloscypha finlandica]|nr:hypothetical protein BGZ57DRAFT_822965 [Hyaloscypha finlandica]
MEVGRLDMLHHIFKLVSHGKLCEAPLPEGIQRVLDIGCGTGIWAIDFGQQRCLSESVLGVDLAPIQPKFVPPQTANFTYRRPFDFTHCSYLAYVVKDWPRLISQVYQHTTPGGFFGFIDFDLVINSDDGSFDNTAIKAWIKTLP